MRNNKNTTFQAIAFGFFIFTMIFIFGIVEPFTKEQEKQEEEISYNNRVVISEEMITIIETFDNNELAGDKQFKDKWIQTYAYFEEVHKSFIDQSISVNMYAKDTNGYELFSYDIRCSDLSDAEIDKVSNFNKDDQINFIGLNNGLLTSSTLYFKQCEFIDY